MKIQLDATKCNGYGTCAEHCPSLFQIDEWGFASVVGDGAVPDDQLEAVRVAVADCPETAITLEV